MSLFSTIILVAAAVPQVELSTLQGKQHKGALQSLSEQVLVLKAIGGEVRVPVKELMEVRLAADGGKKTPGPKTAFLASLVDGTKLSCTVMATANDKATLATAFGRIEVPLDTVSNFRFAPADPKVDAEWVRLVAKKSKKDLLVIRKNDVLDFLDGVVGQINDKQVKFLLGGNEIPVARTRVFGVIYSRRAPGGTARPTCNVVLNGGDALLVRSIAWDQAQGRFRATLLAGAAVDIPPASVQSLDFSLGKVKYLSAMQPRQYRLTTFYDTEADKEICRLRTDRNQDGQPIGVGGQKYERGLWIHSRTQLRYRLGREYRRFQTVVGIEDSVTSPDGVRLTISGDGKVLFNSLVTSKDKPRRLDLDVSNVRDLEILVDFATDDLSDDGRGDHLALADAKVIK